MSYGSNLFGAVMFGESATPAATSLKGIQITINGNLIDYAINSYKRNDNIDGRGSADFKFYDKPPGYPASLFEVGHRVRVSLSGVTLFSGTVDELRREIPLGLDPTTPKVVIYDAKCVDHSQLLDRFLVFAVFEREPVDVTIRWSVGTATVTETSHDYSTGDSVEIIEAGDGDLNGNFRVERINDDAYQYQVGDPLLITDSVTARASRVYSVFDAVSRVINELTKIGEEGVTLGGVVTDNELPIPSLVFDRRTAKQVLDRIAGLYDLTMFIDNDKVLHMSRANTFLAPQGFGENDKDYSTILVKENRKDYRNVQYLGGGKASVALRIENHTAGGDDKSVTLQFPISTRPKIEESSDGVTFNEVPPARIGIKDSDDEDLTVPPDKKKGYFFRWFWKHDDATLAFNNNIVTNKDDLDGNTFGKLEAGDIIRVSYVGLADVLTRADDLNEQSRRAAIEGGSGIYEDSEDEDSLEDTETAAILGEALLKRHGRTPLTISIGCFIQGFKAGQAINLDFPKIGVDGEFLITKVLERDLQGNATTLAYSLQIERLERPRSLFDFWRDATINKEREIRQPSQRKVNTLRKGRETYNVLEVSFSIVTADEIVPIEDDFATIAEMGKARMGAVFMEEPTRVTQPAVPAVTIGGVTIRRIIGPFMVGRPSKPA